MKQYRPLFAALVLAAFMGVHPSVLAADKEPAAEEKMVDPQAISILNRAVDHLAGAKQFTARIAAITSRTALTNPTIADLSTRWRTGMTVVKTAGTVAASKPPILPIA